MVTVNLRLHPLKFLYARVADVPWISLCRFRNIAGYVPESKSDRRGAAARPQVTLKSNFGTTDFLPLDGRWVYERTISWFTGTRRMMRNYEKYLHTATNMAITCMVAFMLRYFR